MNICWNVSLRNEKSQLLSVMSCQYFFILLSCSQYQMSQYSYRLCEPLIVPCIENNCFFVVVFFWGGGGGVEYSNQPQRLARILLFCM